ncbi:MAG TPA: hypothetical protein PKY12_09115 [Catalimonadaceae bacterium]|nr:hypothetical protein [Catalimonadaceae bacterium]
MLKIILLATVALLFCRSLKAQDSSYHKYELGLVSSDFTTPNDSWDGYQNYIIYNTKSEVRKWNIGLDMRYAISKTTRLRLSFGYQERVRNIEENSLGQYDEEFYTKKTSPVMHTELFLHL